MDENMRKWAGRAIRRGVALGMAVTALWCVRLTGGPVASGESLMTMGGGTSAPAGQLVRMLWPLPGQQRAVEGWGRRLLQHSPALSSAEPEILALRGTSGQPLPPAPPTPAEPTAPTQPSQPSAELPDNEDRTEPDLKPQQNIEGVVEMTAKGKEGKNYLWGNGVCLYNRTKMDLDGSILSKGKVDLNMGKGPHILIVHTHGSEAYSQYDGDHYEESDSYRSTDCTHNIVKVGEEIANVFRSHGYEVIHDTNLYDYPAYNGSYDRSKAAVEEWLRQYPSIQMILDVHRDALVDRDGKVYKMVTEENGQKMAQVMMVLGSGDSGAAHPRWKDNLAFAVKLQQGLLKDYDSLARPIVLRSHRYNQQLLPGYLLVEVGGHGNTLTEAIHGAKLWAESVSKTLLSIAPPPSGA